MDVMDHINFEHLSGPPLPGFFGVFSPFSGSDAAQQTETTELDACLRAIGVLPPVLPPSDFTPTSLDQYSAAALDAYVELPAMHMWELYAPALDDHLVKPAIDVVPVPTWLPESAVPVCDVAALKNPGTRKI